MSTEHQLPPFDGPYRDVVYNTSKGYSAVMVTIETMQAYARLAIDQHAASVEGQAISKARKAGAIHIEAFECECGHFGINDAHKTDAACNSCGWSGPSPTEDKCPQCDAKGTMTTACPECSAPYRPMANRTVTVPPSGQAAGEHAGRGEPVAITDEMVIAACRAGNWKLTANSAYDVRNALTAALAATQPAAPDYHAVALELDRLMLVIESAVRHSDPANHAAVMALILANRAAIAKATRETGT